MSLPINLLQQRRRAQDFMHRTTEVLKTPPTRLAGQEQILSILNGFRQARYPLSRHSGCSEWCTKIPTFQRNSQFALVLLLIE